mgnify:CR=1 FL=1
MDLIHHRLGDGLRVMSDSGPADLLSWLSRLGLPPPHSCGTNFWEDSAEWRSYAYYRVSGIPRVQIEEVLRSQLPQLESHESLEDNLGTELAGAISVMRLLAGGKFFVLEGFYEDLRQVRQLPALSDLLTMLDVDYTQGLAFHLVKRPGTIAFEYISFGNSGKLFVDRTGPELRVLGCSTSQTETHVQNRICRQMHH